MTTSSRLFTRESVTEGHPHKICDADRRLDPRCHPHRSPEGARGGGDPGDHGSRSMSPARSPPRPTPTSPASCGRGSLEIGYDSSAKRLRRRVVRRQRGRSRAAVRRTSPAACSTPTRAAAASPRTRSTSRAHGDQGLMCGYAHQRRPPALVPVPERDRASAPVARSRRPRIRQAATLPYLRPDGKTQVTIEYDGDKPVRLDTVGAVHPARRRRRPRQPARAAHIKKYVVDAVLAADRPARARHLRLPPAGQPDRQVRPRPSPMATPA